MKRTEWVLFFRRHQVLIGIFLLLLALGCFLDLWPAVQELATLREQEKNAALQLTEKEAALHRAGPLASRLRTVRAGGTQKPLLDQILQAVSANRCVLTDLQTEFKSADQPIARAGATPAPTSRLLLKLHLSGDFGGFYHLVDALKRQGLPLQLESFSLNAVGDQLDMLLQFSAYPWAFWMADTHALQGNAHLPECCARDPFRDAVALPELVSDFDQVDLRTALRVLAKSIGRTVVLNPAIEGSVTLHLQHASMEAVFDFLLQSQNLQASRMGDIWYIVPRATLLHQKQEEAKWREAEEEAAPLILRLWRIHYARAEDLAHWLQTGTTSLLSKRGQVQVDARSNSLGVRDTMERVVTIETLLRRLDVPLKQIRIETRLASVDSDYEKELGLRFAVANGPVPQDKPGQFSLAIAHLADNSLLDVKLAALENEGHGELISSPSLFTANLQTASIESGEEIPYQEATSSGATSVAFKKAVLSLKVTPQLLPGKKVLLQLQINQDRPNAHLVLGVPTISTRQLITSVLIPDGQTVVLGGIYEVNQEESRESLPIVGRLPIFGRLFAVNNQRRSKRELLIFVTPRVIEW